MFLTTLEGFIPTISISTLDGERCVHFSIRTCSQLTLFACVLDGAGTDPGRLMVYFLIRSVEASPSIAPPKRDCAEAWSQD
jgi:hypothetical protein